MGLRCKDGVILCGRLHDPHGHNRCHLVSILGRGLGLLKRMENWLRHIPFIPTTILPRYDVAAVAIADAPVKSAIIMIQTAGTST